MKKQLLIISIFVVIAGIFVSCSANSCRDGTCSIPNISTTAVADEQGTTHYYEIVTDDTETTALKEIETQADGKAATEKNGKYVIKEHTVVLTTAKSKISSTEKESGESTSQRNKSTSKSVDNEVEFKPDETTSKNTATTDGASPIPTATQTTTKKGIQPATDKDGWITKWY